MTHAFVFLQPSLLTTHNGASSSISTVANAVNFYNFGSRSRSWLSLSMVTDTPSIKKSNSPVDFSSYAVGQEYEGTVVGVKQFGLFVNIGTGKNVLLPRSLLSRINYDKLKSLAESNSTETIKLELVGVSAENQTLSGKYISANYKNRPDISIMKDVDVAKVLDGAVVSAHDFGIFVELTEYGVEGLVPASRLSMKDSSQSIKSAFPVGTAVKVQVESVNVENKRLVLSMRGTKSTADLQDATGLPSNQWFQAIVQNVASFGLFVRPAGFDLNGLVHSKGIPRDLVSTLLKRNPKPVSLNKTDVEYLFSAGDVIKVRVHSLPNAATGKKLELSMLPFRAVEDDGDDYFVEGRDPEGEENDNQFNNDDDEDKSYDAEDTLLWWKGEPYKKSGLLSDAVDEETAVLNESVDIVEGSWRRMFEVDMREDAADFSSKAVDADLKEMEDEIGELSGLDVDLIDAGGFGTTFKANRFGSFVSSSIIPAEWKDELDFFKELESTESTITAKLRGGKVVEQSEFESLLKEVELELEQASARSRGRTRDPVASETAVEESAAAVEEPEVSTPPAEAA
eukprot:gene12900-17284_t